MLTKLALSGMKSKIKDYIVLLTGLIISISIFYMFQTLAWNTDFIEDNSAINSIRLVYLMGSFLLSVITFFYILYANSFLLSLRQKEYGLYMILGARKSKISRFMLVETIFLGLISLALGLILGTVLALLVGTLMANQLGVSLEGYNPFYWPAIIFTIVFFAILFLCSAIWNQWKLVRMQLLKLVYADAENDRIPKKGFGHILLVLFGLVSLGIGYFCLVFMEYLREIGLLTATLMTPLGTYALFMALLPRLIERYQQQPRKMLKGIKAFTFGQLRFRINGLSKMLATAAMLIALGVGAIAGGMAFQHNTLLMVEDRHVYDTVLHNPGDEELEKVAEIPFDDMLEYEYKVEDDVVYYNKDELESQPPLMQSDIRSSNDKFQRIGSELVTGENGFYTSEYEWSELYREIRPYHLSYHEHVVVDQAGFEAIDADVQRVWLGKSDDFLAHLQIWDELDQMQKNKLGISSEYYFFPSKYSSYQNTLGGFSGTVFMGFFLGIAFLAMMASCLMFKILSGASKDIQRYRMLKKIGVRPKLLSQSIFKEMFYVFLYPGIAGLCHVLVGMNLFSFILLEPYYKLWIPIVIFAAIYAMYYFITVKMYKNIVLK